LSGDRIPLVDLAIQHREIAEEVERGFHEVLGKTAFILGPQVGEFEGAFARFCGVGHCVGVANGTDALELILRASGVGPGDGVLLPTNTFIATALAVARAGALAELMDVDPVYHLMDASAVEARISPRTRVLLPVHLYGQMADVQRLGELARERGLLLVEDAAQCQGATRKGAAPGRLAIAAGTSFYPGKNLGAYGDAGAVLTDSDDLARRVRALRNYGSEVKYHHPEVGFNSRLDTLQAVVLKAKLARLAGWNEARRAAARRYDALLSEVEDVVRPQVLPGNEHVWHLYVIRIPRRDVVVARLMDRGIGVQVHYPVPIHLQPAFRSLGHASGDFPVAERAAREVVSLPLYPGISEEQQVRVVEELRAALRASAA
jgi:dTDP-4-amino-4,6-dideoxygalactose transaminase